MRSHRGIVTVLCLCVCRHVQQHQQWLAVIDAEKAALEQRQEQLEETARCGPQGGVLHTALCELPTQQDWISFVGA